MASSIYEDIIITPEDTVLDMYRYYTEDGEYHAFTLITTSGFNYFLKGKTETQLLEHLGLSTSGLETLSIEKRQQILKDNFTKSLVVKCADGFPYAVVTPEYTTVRHRTVWNWVEDILEQRQVYFKRIEVFQIKGSLFARYTTDVHRNGLTNGFYVTNSVRGQGGISFGQSIYINDGDVYITSPSMFIMPHRGNAEKMEDIFKTVFLSSFLEFKIPNIEVMDLPYSNQIDKLDVCVKYKKAIKNRLKKVKNPTIRDYINCACLVAQACPPDSRLRIERNVYKLVFG